MEAREAAAAENVLDVDARRAAVEAAVVIVSPVGFRLSGENLGDHSTSSAAHTSDPRHARRHPAGAERRRCALLWERAREPFADPWALPGGYLGERETLEQSIRRHLAQKVDVRELAHLEQLETRSEPGRHPAEWQLATAYLGLVPTVADPDVPEDTAWHPVDELPPIAFDHEAITLSGRERLRAKLSYTNVGFALAPETFTISELRDVYAAALGHPVSATNLQRVLLRRGVLEPTGERRGPVARAGGRRRSSASARAARGHRPVRRAPASGALAAPGAAPCHRERRCAVEPDFGPRPDQHQDAVTSERDPRVGEHDLPGRRILRRTVAGLARTP